MSIKPANYDILFEPDLKAFKFRGKEKITANITQPTNRLVLNSVELEIIGCRIAYKGESFPAKTKLDKKKEELEIILPVKVRGKVELFLEFEGVLSDKLAGFYRSRYTVGGKDGYLATTQFEPADARRAFPCWDSPEKKATFDISLVIDKGLSAISNMPAAEEKAAGKKKLVRFARTPVMSTYLLYIGVGRFEFIEDRLGGIMVRIATTPGKSKQGRFALECAKKFLAYYQDYFRIKYPLPKLDFIAIPDFASGAMENWGAITFRETILMYDEKTSSTATKQSIAEVLSHELAHQWFGNLVTMRWWNDLWLNESFATLMANKSVDKIFPEWELQNQFLGESVSKAMSLDSLASSHPIDARVRTPSEISEIFDEISYDKGGSILRMLEDFLGEQAFRNGLKEYLSTHRYGNATTEDLWSALEKVSGEPVRKIMDTWVKQTGYPVVKAAVNGSSLVLSQERFMLETRPDRSKWHIPVSMRIGKKRLSRLIKDNLKVGIGKESQIKINFGQKGFYRVEYADGILKGLKVRQLSGADRWGVQNDIFALCVAGKIPISRYVELVRSYWGDDEYIVCSDIESNLYSIYFLSSREKFWPEIKEYNRGFLTHVINRLGWEPRGDEKHTDKLLRAITILYLGRAEDEKALGTAKEKFQAFLKNPNSLHPDLRSAVYNLASWQGDKNMHETLTGLYRNSKTQEEKRRLLASLSGFKDERLLLKTLDFSLSPDVRLQDTFIPIIVASANPYARDLLWPWIKKNWPELKERYSVAKNLLGRIVETLSLVADEKKEDEISKFFTKNPARGTEMAVRQMLERLRINARFLENIMRSYSKVY